MIAFSKVLRAEAGGLALPHLESSEDFAAFKGRVLSYLDARQD